MIDDTNYCFILDKIKSKNMFIIVAQKKNKKKKKKKKKKNQFKYKTKISEIKLFIRNLSILKL